MIGSHYQHQIPRFSGIETIREYSRVFRKSFPSNRKTAPAFPKNLPSRPINRRAFPNKFPSQPENRLSFPENCLSFPINRLSFPENRLSFPENRLSFPENRGAFPKKFPISSLQPLSFPKKNTRFGLNTGNNLQKVLQISLRAYLSVLHKSDPETGILICLRYLKIGFHFCQITHNQRLSPGIQAIKCYSN